LTFGHEHREGEELLSVLDYMYLLKERVHDQEAAELVMMQEQAAGSYTVQVRSLTKLVKARFLQTGEPQPSFAGSYGLEPMLFCCIGRTRSFFRLYSHPDQKEGKWVL
jgi:hypothetical protein